jgi:hypothetical protein
MKKTRRDKPCGFIIYTYMEISQEKSLVATFTSSLNVMCFHFIFPLFSTRKSENRRAEQVLPRGEGWHWGDGGGRG